MIIHIHSDDMGATSQVTTRMLESWRAGVLSSFSVLANGEGSDLMREELAALAQRPARIACHLNLSEGPSSASPSEVPLLVDAEGRLKHTFGSLIIARLRYGRKFLSQVEVEWRAQIARTAELISPRSLAAVDGHMHIHMLPFLFPIAARLARAAGVPEIRISSEPLFVGKARDIFTRSYSVNLVKNLTLKICSAAARPVARKQSLTFPDHMVGVLYTGDMRVERALKGLDAARRISANVVEVVFHVGRAAPTEAPRWKDRDFIARFYYAKERDNEFDAVADLASRLRREGDAFALA